MPGKSREQISQSLEDKEYRDLYVAASIREGIALQIRAMREQRGWTQTELGTRVGMAQEIISRLEDPDYGRLTLRTLRRLASTFDVALIVRFVPFAELADWVTELSANDLVIPAYGDSQVHDDCLAEEPGDG